MRHTLVRAESPAPASRFFAFFFAFEEPAARSCGRRAPEADGQHEPFVTRSYVFVVAAVDAGSSRAYMMAA